MGRKLTITAFLILMFFSASAPFVMAENAETPKVELLFAYSPGCPHCAYEQPIIRQFEKSYPDVKVTWARYSELTSAQEKLIEGTSRHPVMVFQGGCEVRRLVGETSMDELSEELKAFRAKLKSSTCQRSETIPSQQYGTISTTTVRKGPGC